MYIHNFRYSYILQRKIKQSKKTETDRGRFVWMFRQALKKAVHSEDLSFEQKFD